MCNLTWTFYDHMDLFLIPMDTSLDLDGPSFDVGVEGIVGAEVILIKWSNISDNNILSVKMCLEYSL
jgi:hypothetical protein